MSVEIQCDRCETVMERRRLMNRAAIPFHIANHPLPLNQVCTDNDGNRTSGKMLEFDLCNKCSNAVYSVTMKEIKNKR